MTEWRNWAESIFSEVISAPSVFKDKSKLYPEYVPERLPHREQQLKSLVQAFKPLLSSSVEGSQKVVLCGGYGTGKTATSRVFGKTISTVARRHGINVYYVHVNCYKARTLPQVLLSLAASLGIPVPQRGLSAQEVMKVIVDELDRTGSHVIIALDEFDYFVQANPSSSVYFLVRAYDDLSSEGRVHFIFIARSVSSVHSLDKAVSTFFMKNVVYFPPYTSPELLSILRDRAGLAFHEGTVSDDVLEYISILEGYDKEGSGSARTAIEILLRAGESADAAGRQKVSVDDVRKAHVVVKPEMAMLQDALDALNTHQLILLLATVKTLKEKDSPFVRIGDVEDVYKVLCESFNEKPRKHTQVYMYIMEMKKMRIVHTKVSGKGYRGKSTLIGICSVPLEVIESRLEEMLRARVGEGR